MEKAYIGESFEQRFRICDPRDPDRVVTDAQYLVHLGDDIIDTGRMSVSEDGHEASFRFRAEYEGMHRIEIRYGMGQDRFVDFFLMSVVSR